jgi:hypothetical protein
VAQVGGQPGQVSARSRGRRLRDHGARAGKRVRGLRVLAATAVAAVEHQHRDTGHDEQPTEQLVGAALAFDLPRGAAPASPFNQALGPERVLGFGAVPLDRVRRVRAAFGVTVSDIVMATWTRWWRTCSTRTTKLAALAAIRR